MPGICTHKFKGTVQSWGNSLGLRITRPMGLLANIKKGSVVEIEINNQGFIVSVVKDEAPKYTESELVAGLSAHKARYKEFGYA